MKIFNVEQIKAWDQYTIENEPIESLDLMKRAAQKFTDLFCKWYHLGKRVYIFAGQGNNGGDGLVIARLLHAARYDVEVFICKTGKSSADFDSLMKYRVTGDVPLHYISEGEKLPEIPADIVVIDALFGTGLNKPLTGFAAVLVTHLNSSGAEMISVDIPSGMFADTETTGLSVLASRTISFETPKKAFFFSENADRTGEWEIVSIGLHRDYAVQTPTNEYYIQSPQIASFLKRREKFHHKGSYGHALLIAGSRGKAGAAVLSAKGCLRSGAGLLTVHAPDCNYGILQTSVPEAMVSVDPTDYMISEIPDMEPYSAVGIGCGIGMDASTRFALKKLLQSGNKPIVLDADALNIIAAEPEKAAILPSGSIITPHPKEFDRLFGSSDNHFERWTKQREKSIQYGIYILLKGAFSRITTPEGITFFNSTGNPGMATAGSGDVLTGIITGLLAQGYEPLQAALTGTFLHGLAGDLCAKEKSQESMLAGDIVEYLGKAFLEIRR